MRRPYKRGLGGASENLLALSTLFPPPSDAFPGLRRVHPATKHSLVSFGLRSKLRFENRSPSPHRREELSDSAEPLSKLRFEIRSPSDHRLEERSENVENCCR